MILLDTNVWSVMTRPDRDHDVAAWIGTRSDQLWLSVIVIAEIRMGIENPAASEKRDGLTQWLADLELGYAERILDFDLAAAHIFGTLIARRKLQKQQTKILDVQLAAQALSRGCPLATRNGKDFEWTGVKLINPWDA